MKRILLCCFLGWMLALPAGAQITSYQTVLIPKPLLAYANAVVRHQESTTEVKDLDQVVYKYQEAITILNPQGAEYGQIAVFYDKSRQIRNLKVAVYNREGKLIKKAGAGDFQDVSAISDFSLFEDNRVKYYTPLVSDYPYTIAYEYELRIRHTFYFPEWEPQRAADIAVQASSHRFIAKPGFEVRLKEFNLPAPRQETSTSEGKQLEWRTESLPALRPEPYSPAAENAAVRVQIAPVTFEYEGIAGRFSDWKSYGQWAYDHMIKGRDQLPAPTVEKVKRLVAGIDSPREQVKKIYEFSQQKNRYISVQIGIGGLQPMKAEEVDRLGYGDCKALTNYTMALLKVAGIPAIYTEVHAGSRKKDYLLDFASAFQGNHAILCVPLPQDTIWLECTSREAPMGYLGTFTDDRKVLLCTENGGVIAQTRRYRPEQNRQIRTARFNLLAEGTLTGQIETRFEGTQYDNREGLLDKTPKEKAEALQKTYPINNLEILKFDLVQQKTEKPATMEKLEIQAKAFASLNNNLLFVPINQLNREITVPKEVRNRRQKVHINRGFTDEDQIRFVLPAGFKPEYIPPAVTLRNEFGSFSARAELQGNELVYTRKLVLNQGEFAPETYEQLYTFLKKVADADQEKFVLIRK
jgi:transglutaminase-like putative cysteine protease